MITVCYSLPIPWQLNNTVLAVVNRSSMHWLTLACVIDNQRWRKWFNIETGATMMSFIGDRVKHASSKNFVFEVPVASGKLEVLGCSITAACGSFLSVFLVVKRSFTNCNAIRKVRHKEVCTWHCCTLIPASRLCSAVVFICLDCSWFKLSYTSDESSSSCVGRPRLSWS